MIMKTLTINGQTFIVVDADAMKKIADSDLDMNGRIIRNVSDGNEDTDAATVGQVKAVDLTMEKTLTDEQKAQARKNIGALGEIAYVRSIEILGTYQNEIVTITSGSGPDQDTAALLLSPSDDRMNPPIIRNVSDGVQDNDVATVGQLNAAVGDIETSLDSIIAIQESLIGGDAV